MFNSLKSLYTKLALGLTGIFVVIAVVTSHMLLNASSAHQRMVTQHLHCDLAKLVVKEYSLTNNGNIDINAAKMIFMKLMVLGPNFEFYILDNNGRILTYSADPGVVKRTAVDMGPIKQFLKTKDIEEPIFGDNPRNPDQQKIFSAAPLIADGEQLGVLYVILGSDIFDAFSDSLSQSKLLRSGFWLLVASLCFGLTASLVVSFSTTRPLCRLTRIVERLRSQGFGPEAESSAKQALMPWNNKQQDEIGVLANSFQALLERLQAQYQQVITVDDLRKELLTHISHDLRTPLASLLGYLETWQLNRESLTPQQSEQYIAVATRNAKKIANLIEQLFELAHLDSGNVQVNRESFSIAELAGDVLQKFSLDAQKKGIHLKVTPSNNALQVTGDIEKLERVLSNLIENALRHTETGGIITVRLNQQGHFVAIDVEDTGIGIPEHDLPHIFEAHFKAGNSVRENTAHGGIGLAITKKIIELHQSHISVQSVVNQGTTFSFQLPLSSPS